ncbi:MAG: hypothetical protein DHS20C12_30470 [Pseudohongiella sp.]|nr:MAG: hypothetical protein DHS20C12_30470 [Pseudohongiella sp.]
MNLIQLASLQNYLQESLPLLLFVLDMGIKSTLIVVLAFIAQFICRRDSASSLSLLWLITVVALLLLPLYARYLPDIVVSLTVVDNSLATSSTTQAVLSYEPNVYLHSLLLCMSAIYVLICVSLVVYLAHGLYRLLKLSRRSKPCQDIQLQHQLEELRQLFGEEGKVELLVSRDVQSPLTWGLFSHKLILPEAALDWDRAVLEQVMSHELSHMRRKDWIYHLLSHVTVSLLWFNPLVWMAHNRLLLESEKACDDAAIEEVNNSVSYAENLLRVACVLKEKGSYEYSTPTLAKAMLNRRSPLWQRVDHVLQLEKNRTFTESIGIFPILLTVAVIVAPFAVLRVDMEIVTPQVQSRTYIPINYITKESEEYAFYLSEAKTPTQ